MPRLKQRWAMLACTLVFGGLAATANQSPARPDSRSPTSPDRLRLPAPSSSRLAAAPTRAPDEPPRPTLFLVGDSTVQTTTAGQLGWGTPIAHYFDAAKIRVLNKALGGRSSRTFQTEGHWDQVVKELRSGDYLLIQFGHNDAGSLSAGRARGTLPGTGEDAKSVVMEATGRTEVVHSFGWYLRKYVADARAKGATPILCSLVPRNNWKDGRVIRATDGYVAWTRAVAESAGATWLGTAADRPAWPRPATASGSIFSRQARAGWWPSGSWIYRCTTTTSNRTSLSRRMVAGSFSVRTCTAPRTCTPSSSRGGPGREGTVKGSGLISPSDDFVIRFRQEVKSVPTP